MEKSKLSRGHVMGFPVNEDSPSSSSSACKTVIGLQDTSFQHNKKEAVVDGVSKLSKKADSYAQGIREHATLGPKFSETVKGKLSLSARIIQAGGVERAFKQAFSVEQGERLLKASQCYLFTTAGPIAGMLYISTEKIAFRSDRSLALSSSKGDTMRVPYKVVIPLRRIKKASPSVNVKKPEQKYMQIVTIDGFEFWFMGFVSYRRSFKYLQQAISALQ